jgi:hypothetical protein
MTSSAFFLVVLTLLSTFTPQVSSSSDAAFVKIDPKTYDINTIHYPLRLNGIEVLDILTEGRYKNPFETYDVFIDNAVDSLSAQKLEEVYEKILRRPIPADPSSELQDPEGYVRDEIEKYLRFFDSYTGVNFNYFDTSCHDDILFVIDNHLSPHRGYFHRIILPNCRAVTALIFSHNDIREPRSFVVANEMFHELLNMKRAERDANVSDLYGSREIYSTEDSLVLYENLFNFNTPGSLSGDSYLLWLGQYDWSVIQSKGYVPQPPALINTNIYIDGKDVKRGSPGPESWFKDIVIYKDVKSPRLTSLSPADIYEYLADVFRVAYENMWIYRRAVSYSGSDWAFLYFLPWDYGDYFYLWEDLWDLDRTFIKWIPGEVEFKYRSDKMRGPSFHPKMPDYPLRLIVRDLEYASIQLYGSNKTIVLENTSKAHLILGMDVKVEIWGFESEGHCLLLPNATVDDFSCTNEDNQTLLEWSRPHVDSELAQHLPGVNKSDLPSVVSQVLFPDVASCDTLRWCVAPQARQYFLRASSHIEVGECVSFDDCPDSETHSYQVLAYLTFCLLFQFPAFIQWLLVAGLVAMGCGLCGVVVVCLLCQFPLGLQCLLTVIGFIMGCCTCCCCSLCIYKKVAHDYIKDLVVDIYDHIAFRNFTQRPQYLNEEEKL